MINQLDDNTLIKKIKDNNCEDSLKILIERHSPICLSVFKKYLPKILSMGIPAQDIYDDKDYLIWKTAMNFKPEKNSKFTTWLFNHARFKMLNLMNHKSKFPIELDSIDYLSDDSYKNDEREKNFKNYIINVLGQITDPRIKKIYKMRYFGDKEKPRPWKQIGKKLHISAQTAINLHNKHKDLLRNKLKSKNRSDFI